MKLEFSRQPLEKYSNINFQENVSIGGRIDPCGRKERQTDRYTYITKLTVAVGSYANAPEKRTC
jgi:hypothetical protein